MKKTFIILAIVLLTLSTGFAASENVGQGGDGSELQDSGQGNAVQTEVQTNQQNQGNDTKVQNKVQTQNRVKDGEFQVQGGKKMKVQSENGEKLRLYIGNVSARTDFDLRKEVNAQNQMQLKTKLSNGRNAEIKVMPDVASKRALERLQLRNCNSNCSIELKEVGSGNQSRAVYEVQAQKQARMLGIFATKMNVSAQIDAETGDVVRSQKPWWAFLASESEE